MEKGKRKEGLVPVSFWLPRERRDAFKFLAEKMGMNFSSLIRFLLVREERSLSENKPKTKKGEK